MKKTDIDRITKCIDDAWEHEGELDDIKQSVRAILSGKTEPKTQSHDHPLFIYILENYPIVSKLTHPTYEQCNVLKDSFHHKLIIDKLDAMENRKKLLVTYSSLFLTLKNWCNMAMRDGWKPATENKPLGPTLKKYE